MLLECDEVAVDVQLWDRAIDGDEAAVEALQKAIHGLVLYLHAFPVAPNETVVTLRELEQYGVLKSVTLNTVE